MKATLATLWCVIRIGIIDDHMSATYTILHFLGTCRCRTTSWFRCKSRTAVSHPYSEVKLEGDGDWGLEYSLLLPSHSESLLQHHGRVPRAVAHGTGLHLPWWTLTFTLSNSTVSVTLWVVWSLIWDCLLLRLINCRTTVFWQSLNFGINLARTWTLVHDQESTFGRDVATMAKLNGYQLD